MRSALGLVQSQLVTYAGWIQLFFLCLGLGLVVVPLVVAPPPPLVVFFRVVSKKVGVYTICKRLAHYGHLALLRASEDMGLFTVVDTVAYWTSCLFIKDTDDDVLCNNDSLPLGRRTTHAAAPLIPASPSPAPLAVCVRAPPLENQPTDDDDAFTNPYFVSGLVNTGNSCYLNSVLQAMSSLPALHVYLERLNQQHYAMPVSRAMLSTMRQLCRPLDDQMPLDAFSPVAIASSVRHRVISREQEDAQELFQVLADALDQERALVSAAIHKPNGLLSLLSYAPTPAFSLDNPFRGFFASRLSCTTCGYVEAIRHFSFNNIQLALPQTPSTTLYECLDQWTGLEYLEDVTCRQCAMTQWLDQLETSVDELQSMAKACTDLATKRGHLTQLVQLETQRREAAAHVHSGAWKDDEAKIPKDALRGGFGIGVSTKQVMFAKMPPVLCLHVARSTFHPSGLVYKNKCQLQFPERLDMRPFCTNGTIHTDATEPISSPDDNHSSESQDQGHYRLMSVIVHYGSHNYGHFIAYKRQINASSCQCDACTSQHARDRENEQWHASKDLWYRISDENVDVCPVEEVLNANPYMLLYERVDSGDARHHRAMDASSSVCAASIISDQLSTASSASICSLVTPCNEPCDDNELQNVKSASSSPSASASSSHWPPTASTSSSSHEQNVRPPSWHAPRLRKRNKSWQDQQNNPPVTIY
ncbi:hypothetical protein BC940DRAFT_330999 [Gongronella butleri]|nr:hypothetical protein BC940DRAFT_330999 [Gongronella butleri]